VLLLDEAERTGHLERECMDVDVLLATGEIKLECFQARPLAPFLEALEGAAEQLLVFPGPAIGRSDSGMSGLRHGGRGMYPTNTLAYRKEARALRWEDGAERLAGVEAFDTNPIGLRHLLSLIHAGELALPDFQRDFVWDPKETEELLESISRSFPAGSLLFMPWRDDDVFSPRAVQGAPDLAAPPNRLILDGQQRLSSLYQACYGAGEYRYFIAFGPLTEDEDVEEAIFYRHRNRCGKYSTIEQQADLLVMPLGALFGSGGGFHAWSEQITKHRSEKDEELDQLRATLRRTYEAHVKPIEDYHFPVVILAQSTSLEAVCSIFETLNRTGIRLSVFDLLAARFFAKNLDPRLKWEKSVADAPIIQQFEIDRYYLLQSIALRVKGSVKRGDVLALTVDDIEAHWDSVVAGYRAALEMLRDECGVRARKWLPYGYLLVPLAALWRDVVEVAGPASGANRGRLKAWFWCSGISASYDRAANTQASRDYAELKRWIEGDEPPLTVREFEFDPARLREITPKQQSIYKALMALVIQHGARDLHHGQTLTQDSIVTQSVDDHHIFPRAYLNPRKEEPAYPTQLVDCILNRTMIDATTNRRIGKRPPDEYLGEIRAELEGAKPGAFDDVLRSHLLPVGDQSPLVEANFEEFLDRRQELFIEAIAEATGMPVGASASSVVAL
jgi:hypothetical protein